jgi:hypothetical protein
MLRRYELIDMVVAIGFCATIAATDWQANLDRAIVVAYPNQHDHLVFGRGAVG